jgi:exosortase
MTNPRPAALGTNLGASDPMHGPSLLPHSVAFNVLIGVSLLLWRHPLLETLRLALADSGYTHLLLVIPLSGALVYFERDKILRGLRWNLSLGGAFLSAAILFFAYANWRPTGLSSGFFLTLNIFALVVWWIGAFISCFGLQVSRSFRFPLAFLLLFVPIPESAMTVIIVFLQEQSAWGARILFHVARVPVQQDGVMLSIPGLDIEVARECSSIRSSLMLMVTTLILAHLFLRSWWRKILLVAAAIPLSVAKNALRIFTIAELGTRGDPSWLDGKFHHSGGIVFFGLSVIAIFVLLWMLHKGESSETVGTTIRVS